MPPALDAMTGRPQESASNITAGSPSILEGKMNISADFKILIASSRYPQN